MKKELPIMIFHKDNQDYYGGDQDWFSDEWARRAGCASVCAADMACFYEHKLDISYPDFLELMTKMFKLNTPGIMGFPYFYKFAKNFKKYMKHIGLDVEPIYQKIAESPEQGVHFVKTAIDQGHPIGMLILTHEAQILEEETWHWMCITGYEEIASDTSIIFSSCGERVCVGASTLFNKSHKNIVKLVTFD